MVRRRSLRPDWKDLDPFHGRAERARIRHQKRVCKSARYTGSYLSNQSIKRRKQALSMCLLQSAQKDKVIDIRIRGAGLDQVGKPIEERVCVIS
jgi:hypothetical protein